MDEAISGLKPPEAIESSFWKKTSMFLHSSMASGANLFYLRALLAVAVSGEADLGLGLSGLAMISGCA